MIDRTGQNLQDGVQDFGRGDTQAVDKAALHAALGEKPSHLFAAAMNDDALILAESPGDFARQPLAGFGSIEQRAPQLYEDLTNSQKPGGLGEPQRQIHILDGLAGGTLDQVIDGANYHGAARSRVEIHADIAKIRTLDGRKSGSCRAGRAEQSSPRRPLIDDSRSSADGMPVRT